MPPTEYYFGSFSRGNTTQSSAYLSRFFTYLFTSANGVDFSPKINILRQEHKRQQVHFTSGVLTKILTSKSCHLPEVVGRLLLLSACYLLYQDSKYQLCSNKITTKQQTSIKAGLHERFFSNVSSDMMSR